MSQVTGMKPWLTMWGQPKSTVRAIVHSNPSYGVFYLAAIYALQSLFFYANWWSLGIQPHFYLILFAGIVLSPLIGLVWVYYLSFVFYCISRLFGGRAPMSHVRTAVAWSLIPVSINLLMWLVLIFLSPHNAFIQDTVGPSSIFINLIGLILGIWSIILLIQGLCEVEQFSLPRSIAVLLISWFISSLTVLLFFALLRYIYIVIV